MPQSLSAMVLYYRTDLFKEIDIDPASLTTWEKLVSAGEKVVKDHGKAMIALDPTYFGILLRQRGVICLARTVIPTARRRSRCWAGCASRWSPASAWCRACLGPLFFNSQCSSVMLTVVGADWYGLDMLQQFTPDLKGKWGAMPLPAWKLPNGKLSRRTSTFAGQGLMINKGSKQPDAAWKFIEFVIPTRNPTRAVFSTGTVSPPTRRRGRTSACCSRTSFSVTKSLANCSLNSRPSAGGGWPPESCQGDLPVSGDIFNSLIYGELKPAEVVDKMKTMLEAAERILIRSTCNERPAYTRADAGVGWTPFYFCSVSSFPDHLLVRAASRRSKVEPSANGFGEAEHVGLNHYYSLAKDERFFKAIRNSFVYTLASIVVIVPLSLWLAHLLRSTFRRLRPVLTFALLPA